MPTYQTLLKQGKKQLPEVKETKERFEIPKVKGHIEGNKTIIVNFTQIANTLRREPNQLLKYLQRELATPATLDKQRLILGRKLSASNINQKIEQYAKDFVICQECKKPDTKLDKESKVLMIKCMACGAKHSVKAKI